MKNSPLLAELIERCRKGERDAQKALYAHFYGYAMSICLRYALTEDESKEILNDGFMKVFTRLEKHDDQASFKAWLRKIMIHTAIDYYRSNRKYYHNHDTGLASLQVPAKQADSLDAMSYDELIEMIRQLPPSYRTVFNLYAIEGYTHEEISAQLGISVGTSKSSLFKARERLRIMLQEYNTQRYA